MGVECTWCGQDTDLMTTTQVARLFGVSERAVRGWCRRGRFNGATHIPRLTSSRGIWRIPASAVLPLLQDGEYIPRPDYSHAPEKAKC